MEHNIFDFDFGFDSVLYIILLLTSHHSIKLWDINKSDYHLRTLHPVLGKQCVFSCIHDSCIMKVEL